MRRVLVLGALLVACALSACDATQPYAAIVNGTRISQSQLVRELDALSSNQAFVTAYDQAQQGARPGVLASHTVARSYSQSFTSAVLGLEVQSQVVHAEVVRRHLEPTKAAIDDPATAAAAGQQFGGDVFTRFPNWLRHLFQQRQAEQDALGKALGTTAVTDAAIQKFYDDNAQDFITTQCVSHILLKTQGEANAVFAQLEGGADFATLATQNSIDATTAPKGGDLGCNPPGQGTNPVASDQQFLAAATKAKQGTVTQPVQIASGWDLIKVTSRTLTPLTAQVKQAIQTQLQQQAAQPLNLFFQQAAKTLKVEVNPAYGRWDGQQLAVVAPKSPDPARSGLPTPLAPAVAALTTTIAP